MYIFAAIKRHTTIIKVRKVISEKTKTTPRVTFNPESKVLEFSGILIPEDPVVFFRPVFNWLDDYVKNGESQLTFVIGLIHFNSSSATVLVSFMKKLAESGPNFKVVWQYEASDEEQREIAEEFYNILGDKLSLESVD